MVDSSPSPLSHIYVEGFQKGLYSDVTVRALGTEFRLHRLVLLGNAYFAALLQGPFAEGQRGEVGDGFARLDYNNKITGNESEEAHILNIQLDDPVMTPQALRTVFARLYGFAGPAELTRENACATLAAAVFFLDKELAEQCVSFIVRDLDGDSILTYLHFVDSFHYGKYSDDITDAIFTILVGTARELPIEVFVGLSRDWLERVFRAECLCVDNDLERYRLLCDILAARKSAYGLISHTTKAICLPACPSKFVDDNAEVLVKSTLSNSTPVNNDDTDTTNLFAELAISSVGESMRNSSTFPASISASKGVVNERFPPSSPTLRTRRHVLTPSPSPPRSHFNFSSASDEEKDDNECANTAQKHSGFSHKDNWRQVHKTFNHDENTADSEIAASHFSEDAVSEDEDAEREAELAMHKALLSEAVTYPHLALTSLLEIQRDAFVPSETLHRAHWQQSALRVRIEACKPETVELGLAEGPSAPRTDTDKIDGRPLSAPAADVHVHPHEYFEADNDTLYAPFRFSAKFPDLQKHLVGSSRYYSRTEYYAGSYWVVYLQKLSVDGVNKLGVYLQRWACDDAATQNALPVPEHRYVDRRIATKTWFKIFAFLPHHRCYVLESKPDMFKSTQSWGWRSSKLYRDALVGIVPDDIANGSSGGSSAGKLREQRTLGTDTLTVCVVLGHV